MRRNEETTIIGLEFLDQPAPENLKITPTKHCLLALHSGLLHFGIEEVIVVFKISLNQVLD